MELSCCCCCRVSGFWFRFSRWGTVSLVVWNKFLHPCPCNGHHWDIQLDPGLRGVRWRSGRRAFTISAGCFFPLSVYATQKQLLRKKLCFFGWVWIISPFIISQKNKSEHAASIINMFLWKKGPCLCVLAQNHLEFMESFHIISHPQSKMLQFCMHVFLNIDRLLCLHYSNVCIFLGISILTNKKNNTQHNPQHGWSEWKHSRHQIKKVLCLSCRLSQTEAMCCTFIWSLKPSVAPDRKHCCLLVGGCFYGNWSRWGH